MPFGDKPYGLRDLKLTNITGTVQVDLPAALKLKFAERVKSDEFRGDDRVQAAIAWPEAADWEMEAGGISLEAYALMTGRTVSTSGSAPNQVKEMAGTADDLFPYFKIYGKVISESGDLHCKLFKCKVMKDIEGTFEDGKFWTTGVKGVALEDGTNGIYKFAQNETAANLPTT